MSEGFHSGGYDALNSGALAEARQIEAGLPSRRHIDAPRWLDVGTILRAVGLVIVAAILGGWLLTLLNVR
jgi:hypothetical protein